MSLEKEKMTTEEYKATLKEKLDNDEVIKFLKENIKFNCYLTGGAVIDIIEGRTPKDYDIVGLSDSAMDKLDRREFTFISDTKSATTFRISLGGKVVQFLKKSVSDFPFKIEQSKYPIHEGDYFTIDLDSVLNKALVPTNFGEVDKVISGLSRIPHWAKKGYTMHPLTYLTQLGTATNQKKLVRDNSDDYTEES